MPQGFRVVLYLSPFEVIHIMQCTLTEFSLNTKAPFGFSADFNPQYDWIQC